jgi:beta-fructofuranosidase
MGMTTTAAAHPDFPVHRVRPPAGWLNDPNGPIRWRDRYHVFFQYNPHSPVHDSICWGHASSVDLVHWHYEPVALRPTPGTPDAGGIWSGCTVADRGSVVAIYTGIREGADTATICLATADDDQLLTWTKADQPVASPPEDLDLQGFRDPFLFHYEGHRYGLVGAGEEPGRRPSVLLYECDDLTRWNYLGPLLDATSRLAMELAPADIWECPQLFRLGGRWVLVVSLVLDGLTRVSYLVGDLVSTDGAPRLVVATGGLVDHGHDFYAPAVLLDGDRVLLWGWTWEDRADDDVLEAGWAGALTLARELSLGQELHLLSRPAAETSLLHGEETRLALAPGEAVELPPGAVDVTLELAGREPSSLAILGNLTLELDPVGSVARLVRDTFEPQRRGWDTSGPWRPDDLTRIRVMVDGSVVEVYVDGGPTFTERVYAVTDRSIVLTTEAATLGDLVIHRLPLPA